MLFDKGLLGTKNDNIGGDLIDFLAKLAAKYFTKYKVFLEPMEEDVTCLF